jgi:hypothetical protein
MVINKIVLILNPCHYNLVNFIFNLVVKIIRIGLNANDWDLKHELLLKTAKRKYFYYRCDFVGRPKFKINIIFLFSLLKPCAILYIILYHFN